jgi:tetraacyldisaccharide 4'-kinase
MTSLPDRLLAAWYAPRLTPLAAALLPLSWLFRLAIAGRRCAYRLRVLRAAAVPVPVVVIGSILVGGVGKTPLTQAFAEALAARGFKPGIVSRGYGGANVVPHPVRPGDSPEEAGDEPLLLATGGAPVWIGRDRAAAARALLAAHPECDVLLCDDGLQHYALGRDVEIAVVDAARGLGNGRLLPAGPLREPPERLREVDAVVRLVEPDSFGRGLGPMNPAPQRRSSTGASGRESTMWYEPLPWRSLVEPDAVPDVARWRSGPVHAIAGVGHPDRFFSLVRSLGFDPVCHAFADHHRYARRDLDFPDAVAILMTEKDAVKCAWFADARCWYLPIRAHVDPALVERVERKIRGSEAA